MMGYALALFVCWFCRPDIEVPINGPRIGTDYLAIKLLCQVQGKRSLATGSLTHNHNQGRHINILDTHQPCPSPSGHQISWLISTVKSSRTRTPSASSAALCPWRPPG